MTTDLATTRRPGAPPIVSILNPIIRRLLGVGLPIGPNVLLTVRGRSSGLARTFPVAILQTDGRRFVQSPFGEVNWVRNLRVAGEAVISKGGERLEVEALELSPEVGGAVLQAALAPFLTSRLRAAFLGRFFRIRPDSRLADYVAEARRHPMFELRPRAIAGQR
jgi:deazaflavin-dependent oxidoreductase (nitroreductase family)